MSRITWDMVQRAKAERDAISASMPPEPDRPCLTPAEIRALPTGTPLLVKWSGGNGPHCYHAFHESYDGEPPFGVEAYTTLWDGRLHWVDNILEWNHEERWGERMLHKVWLADG